MRVGTVDGVLLVVDIENNVDASISQSIHALVVVHAVVDSIDTDSIDAQVLELGDVSLANIGIGEGIDVGSITTGLVVDTTHVPALAISPESCSWSVMCIILRHCIRIAVLTSARGRDSGERRGALAGWLLDRAGGVGLDARQEPQ